MAELLSLARSGIAQLRAIQENALASRAARS
jgi:hypothetical protein